MTKLIYAKSFRNVARYFWCNTKYDRNPPTGSGPLITVTGTTVAAVNAPNSEIHRYICQVNIHHVDDTSDDQNLYNRTIILMLLFLFNFIISLKQ